MIIHRIVDKMFRIADRVVGKVFGSYVSERQKLKDGTVKDHYSPRVHIHWQNLNDNKRGEPKGVPYEGRCWLWFRGFGKRRNNSVGFSWNLWRPHWLFSFSFGVKTDEEDVSVGVGVWPFSFHFHIACLFPRSFNDWWMKKYRYGGREFWFYSTLAEEAAGWFNVVFHLWEDPMGGGGCKKGWKRLTDFYLDFPDCILSPVFGKLKFTEETLETKVISIPMPEGVYQGDAKLSRATWKRPRLPWVSLMRHGAHVDIPIGIPYEGKSENSWDCGEDGVFGIGTDKASYPALIARVVEHVLDQRRKRDGNMDAKYPDPILRKLQFEKRMAEKQTTEAQA